MLREMRFMRLKRGRRSSKKDSAKMPIPQGLKPTLLGGVNVGPEGPTRCRHRISRKRESTPAAFEAQSAAPGAEKPKRTRLKA
jgi:hypothetical protein